MENQFNIKYHFNFYKLGIYSTKDSEFIFVEKGVWKKYYADKELFFYEEDNIKKPYSFIFHLNNIWFPRFKYKNNERNFK